MSLILALKEWPLRGFDDWKKRNWLLLLLAAGSASRLAVELDEDACKKADLRGEEAQAPPVGKTSPW